MTEVWLKWFLPLIFIVKSFKKYLQNLIFSLFLTWVWFQIM